MVIWMQEPRIQCAISKGQKRTLRNSVLIFQQLLYRKSFSHYFSKYKFQGILQSRFQSHEQSHETPEKSIKMYVCTWTSLMRKVVPSIMGNDRKKKKTIHQNY